MRRNRVVIALLLLVTVAVHGPGAQTTQPGTPPSGGVTVYPQPTAGWDTAVSHPGDATYYRPAYPIAFVVSPVVETTGAMCNVQGSCSTYTGGACQGPPPQNVPGTVYPNATQGNYHTGADVVSANDPDPGNELWIYLPATGQVKKLFPRPIHETSGLIDFAKENGSVVEPNLSEDGSRLYFSYFQDATDAHSTEEYQSTLSLAGADLYAIDIAPLVTNPLTSVDSLQVTRLTTRAYSTSVPWQQTVADRDKAAMNPTLVATTGIHPKTDYGTVFMHATEVRTAQGLHLAYVSNQRRLDNSNQGMDRANHNFNLHLAPLLADGTLGPENNQLQYYTTTSALSPTPLRQGLAFSYQSSTDEARLWHIQGLDSEGRWYPLVGYGANPELFHLASFCVGEDDGIFKDYLVATRYYNVNNEGFGSLWRQDLSLLGKNTYDNLTGSWKVPRQAGSLELTDPPYPAWSLSQDNPSPVDPSTGQYYGKFTAPRCGGVNQLYFSYTPTSANGKDFDPQCNKDKYRAHIAYRPNLDPFVPGPWSGTQGSKIVIRKTSNDVNLMWAVPIVRWSTRTNGDPVQQVAPTSAVTPGPDILPGEPFARIGTSALWNTDRRPFECYLLQPTSGAPRWYSPWGVYNVNQENDLVVWNQDGWTWVTQGAGNDFCVPPAASQILGLAINVTSNKANMNDSPFGYTTDGAVAQQTEAARLLGVYDVRGQSDQSVLALIPSHTPIELQAIDRVYGMKLTDVRSWHSLKPRESRTDCGGCHQHDIHASPVPFAGTYASTHAPLDLVRSTTSLSYDAHCNVQTEPASAAPALDYPEWRQDIWPAMDAYCGSCHNASTGNGTGNAALQWASTSQTAGDQVYNDIGNRRFASALRGALGSQLFWAARGHRTDGRSNTAYPADYDCVVGTLPGQCSLPQKWGFQYTSAHDTLGLPAHRCSSGDAAYASWVFKLGKWIDNHMPRNTGSAYPYKFDWYHPTADSAISSASCATTQLRVGWWDDSNRTKSVQVLLNDTTTLYNQQWPSPSQPIANGSALISLPTVSLSDWITVEVRDAVDNRQVYRKQVEQLVSECTPGP